MDIGEKNIPFLDGLHHTDIKFILKVLKIFFKKALPLLRVGCWKVCIPAYHRAIYIPAPGVDVRLLDHQSPLKDRVREAGGNH